MAKDGTSFARARPSRSGLPVPGLTLTWTYSPARNTASTVCVVPPPVASSRSSMARVCLPAAVVRSMEKKKTVPWLSHAKLVVMR